MNKRTCQILIVEDEVIVSIDLQSRLEALGYMVLDTAISGEEACEKALSLYPDLIFMDIRLSGDMDGIEASEKIRAQRDIPVVFITAYVDQDTLQRAKITGPHGYIVKPFDERDLQATIEIALYRHQMQHELRKRHDDMLTILDAQRQGTVMINEQGDVVYLSKSARRLLCGDKEHVLGRPWQSVIGLSQRKRAWLENMLHKPPAQRTKISGQLHNAEGHTYFVEIEVQDDPRATEKKILFLYDVSEVNILRGLLDNKSRFHNIVGKSKPIQAMIQLIHDLAQVDSNVLIEGETGTGKELVAHAIHNESHRKNGPFIALNCAGLNEQLVGSQLFGHRRGSFTGAVSDQVGLFEAAKGGTLFLDEFGELPLSIQSTLLRVLEEKSVTRLGETAPRQVDVRFLAATNRDLAEEVVSHRFRADLFYRIRVAHIHLPPLRERREDIALLARTFLAEHIATTGKRVDAVGDAALQVLLSHDWPGNVRELKNALEYALIRCKGSTLQPDDLPPEIWEAHSIPDRRLADHPTDEERGLILAALEQTGGNRTEAAKLLGVSRATFYRRLTDYGL